MGVIKAEIPNSLSKSFPKEFIETDYRGFSYVSPNHYRKALNEAFGTNWSFEILNVFKETTKDKNGELHDEIIVHCKLTIYVKEHDDTGEIIKIEKHGIGGKMVATNYSDAYKSAKSVALKNACVELGLGLDLYENEVEDDRENTDEITVNTQQNENKVIPENFKATDKQVNFTLQLIKKTNHPSFKGLTDDQIKEYLSGLSKHEISKIIEKLRKNS